MLPLGPPRGSLHAWISLGVWGPLATTCSCDCICACRDVLGAPAADSGRSTRTLRAQSRISAHALGKAHNQLVDVQDVLKEAEQYNSQVLVAHESDDFQVVERWEPVTEVDVQTPLDVYRELAGVG